MSSYELIDSGGFHKLEQVGPYRIVRPSPQAVWQPRLGADVWDHVDARFQRFSGGDGRWHKMNRQLPKSWVVHCEQMQFEIRLTDFGHLGLFAEQATNWGRIRELCRAGSQQHESFQVLNLFGYTGGSTLAAAQGGAHVVHLDASKTSVAWARDQAALNDLADKPVRWIVDDAAKFVARERRRGRRYHGIILDPPSFGRGSKGEVWKIEEHLCELLSDLAAILAEDYAFVLLTSHSEGYTPLAMRNLIDDMVSGVAGRYTCDEMVIPEAGESRRVLPSGASCLFERTSPL